MIAFTDLTIDNKRPIYLQLLTYIKQGVAAGQIKDGDELPSRRMLSALLGVNPNTIQRAYRMLEEEGLIESHTGARSLMVADPGMVAKVRAELAGEETQNLVAAMKKMGVTREEAHDLLDSYWEKGETDEDSPCSNT